MKKKCFICQPYNIGDVLFIQKIIRYCAEIGFHVVMPLRHDLRWMRYYIAPHPDIEYPLIKEFQGSFYGDFEDADLFLDFWRMSEYNMDDKTFNYPVTANNVTFLGLAALWKRLPNSVMTGKYEFMGLDYHDWPKHVFLKRRPHVERELFYDVLGLKDGYRYTLVNEHASTRKLDLHVPGNIVKMQQFDGFTLIDWCMVIERATQVATIDTSLVLLVEILQQQKPLHIVSRFSPPTFHELGDMLTLEWNKVLLPEDLKVEPVW